MQAMKSFKSFRSPKHCRVKIQTLQTALTAHGCFKHAFLHSFSEHCSVLSQSESLRQLNLTDPSTISRKLKKITKIGSI